MKIPKQFNLFGETIRVEWLDKAKDIEGDSQLLGLAKYQQNVIEIAKTDVYGIPITHDNLEQTFLHEALHFMLEKMGSNKRTDEAFVDILSSMIHQMLQTAKG